MKKLLITGFDPFGGESVNPAYEAVRLLPDVVAGIKLCKLEVPTEFVRGGAVLRDALAAERPDAVLSMQPVDLAAIATKAALEMESIAYEKCVTLETALPEACILRGNTDYLQRIVISLLENALKYEPSGGRVHLALTQDKRRARLSVQNFGSTIPAEDLPHVFDRFYRSDKSRKSESGSFGLGLAITMEMVEKLGGEISVSSSAEGGTVFQVTLCR